MMSDKTLFERIGPIHPSTPLSLGWSVFRLSSVGKIAS